MIESLKSLKAELDATESIAFSEDNAASIFLSASVSD